MNLSESYINRLQELSGLLLVENRKKDFLIKRYDISEKDFNILLQADPTSVVADSGEIKKVGDYVEWLIRLYKAENIKEEDLYKTKDYLTVFTNLKKKGIVPADKSNILRYRELSSLHDYIEPYLEEPDIPVLDSTKYLKLGQAEVVYDDGNWRVIIPKSLEASCFYGVNTQWCTARPENSMFAQYSKDGPIYILISKKTKSPTYQFHFETKQFMDVADRQIGRKMSELFQASPGLLKLFSKRIDKSFKLEDKYKFGIPFTKNDIAQMSISEKIKYDIELTPDEKKFADDFVGRIKSVVVGADPKNVFFDKDFEGYKDYYFDDDAVKIDINTDEFEKYFSGIDEHDLIYYNIVTSYDYYEEIDDDELNYMHLSSDNINKLKEIAKILNMGEYDFETREEGVISNFIEKYIPQHSKKIFNEYLTGYSDMQSNAKKKSVLGMVAEQQKFKYEDGYLVLPWKELYLFMQENPDKKMASFYDLKDAEINEVSGIEDAYSDYYNEIEATDMDYAEEQIGKILDEFIVELEDSSDEYIQNIKTANRILKDLKFDDSKVRKRNVGKKSIFINDIDYNDGTFEIAVQTYDKPADEVGWGDKPTETSKGKIPFDRLADYVSPYSLFENKIRKMVRKILLAEAEIKKNFRLNDILKDLPSDINDIFQICQNEMALTGNDSSNIMYAFYKFIYFYCFLEHYGLTAERKEKIIPVAKKYLATSDNLAEAEKKFQELYDNKHELRFAVEMQYVYHIDFESQVSKHFNYQVLDIIKQVIEQKLSSKAPHTPKTALAKIMRIPVTVDYSHSK